MLSLAIVEEGTTIGFHAAFRQVKIRLLLALENLQCLTDSSLHFQILIVHHHLHVVDNKKLLDVEIALTHIVAIKTDEIGACHMDATLREYPLLVSDIWGILLQLRWLSVELWEAGALHLIDSPTVRRLAQDIDCTILRHPIVFETERSLSDVLNTFLHPLTRLFHHRCEVEPAVWQFSMRLLEVAKELHGEIAHDISLFKTSLQTSIYCCLFRLKHLQPEILRALAESRVT